MPEALTAKTLKDQIHVIRGLRVMLDADLADFYGVATKVLNQAVRRNIHRFPEDFAFQLTTEEFAELRSQTVTSNTGRGGRRFRPWAFTEHGVVMLASILNSAVAIAASVEIVRAFMRLRNAVAFSGTELVAKLLDIEKRLGGHDTAISQLFSALRQLLEAPKPSPSKEREMGFHVREDEAAAKPAAPRRRKTIRYR